MKIKVVSDDYIDFFKNQITDNLAYPIDNKCFNMSFSKFYNNQYLFCVRNIITYKQLIKKEALYPGISQFFIDKSNKFIEDNFSDLFIWTWRNYYEVSIFFAGDINIKTLKIIPNEDIKPYVLISPTFSFKLPKYLNNKLIDRFHIMDLGDFRLFFYNNILYIYDAKINIIYQMLLIGKKLILKKLYLTICELEFKNNGSPINNLNKYTKISEKNWSLYNVVRNYQEGDIEFKFIHDFEEDGLYGVSYYPKLNKCKKVKLVNYPKNTFPIDNSIIRFSLSSPCIKLQNNVYIGIGHIKIKFVDEINNITNSIDKHFYDMANEVHTKMRKKFKIKYRPHRIYVYMNFLFKYNNYDKTFYISDFFLPVPKYDYYFSLSFLMAISKVDNTFILAGGLGDYCNIMISMDEKDVLSKIKYNISNLDITKINYFTI